jgi:hypothetical protein
MVAKIYDKVLLVVAILLVAASVVLVVMQRQKFDPMLKIPPVAPGHEAYVPVTVPVADVPTEKWVDPPPQSQGVDWVYEVFTSPKIFYLPGPPAEFVAHPPTPKTKPQQPPFGVEFVQVKSDPFRLQLVGFVGQDGVFAIVGGNDPAMIGETFLARSGKELGKLNLLIRSFEVKPMPMLNLPEGSTPLTELAGVAVVVDTQTKEETTLTTQQPLLNGNPFALLKSLEGVQLDPMKAGATFSLPNGRKYKIEAVTEKPVAMITVTKTDDPDPVFAGPVKMDLTLPPPAKTKGKRPTAPVVVPAPPVSRHAPTP